MHALYAAWPQTQTRSFPLMLYTWASIPTKMRCFLLPEGLCRDIPSALHALPYLLLPCQYSLILQSIVEDHLFTKPAPTSLTRAGPVRSFDKSLNFLIVSLYLLLCVNVIIWPMSASPTDVQSTLRLRLIFYSQIYPQSFALPRT